MAMLHALIRTLVTLLPPTVHPMMLHFPITFLYMTAVLDLLARVLPDRDRFLQRAGFWGLTLAAFSTVVTMAAGAISERSVHFTPAMRSLLSRHQFFAVLTGLAEGAAWLTRVFTPFPGGRGWSVGGRGRGGWASTAFVVAAALLVTVTSALGGRLVYDHGAGVLGVTRGA